METLVVVFVGWIFIRPIGRVVGSSQLSLKLAAIAGISTIAGIMILLSTLGVTATPLMALFFFLSFVWGIDPLRVD